MLADAVLVTLPLGVMKRGSVAFSPPLPEYACLSSTSLSHPVYVEYSNGIMGRWTHCVCYHD